LFRSVSSSASGPAQPGELSGKTALITGASGFLGSHLRRRLSELGAEVHGVSRKTMPARDEDGIRWWQGDFADLTEARRVVGAVEPDLLFHLSGLVTGRTDRELVVPTMESLLVSTVNALVAASEHSSGRVVLVGSMDEPDDAGVDDPVPASPYATAKWASVAYGRMFHRVYRTPVVIARTYMTYGPGQGTTKLVPHVILSLLRNESPELANGERMADWVYIDDVIDGFIAVASTPGVEGRTFDLGTGIPRSNRSVVEEIVALIESEAEPSFGAIPARASEPERVAIPNDSKAVLGWEANTTLQEGVERTIKWYASQALLIAPILQLAPLISFA
jgi:UDP-glucose 4-epimerase